MVMPLGTDGSIDDLGILITAMYGLDQSWMKRGSCFEWGKSKPRQPTPWQVVPGRLYNGIPGGELVQFAALMCRSCPAQWDCARFAVEGKMMAGTWSMPITELRWMQKQEGATDLIEDARKGNKPVQVAVREALAERRCNA